VSYLLDTNVVSELRRSSPNPDVKSWFEQAAGDDLFLSVIVVGEIRQGIERVRSRDPEQANGLERWLEVLHGEFQDRLLPVSTSVAEEWGRLNAPSPLPVIDSLLAATALVHGLTFVTRDTSALTRTGVALFDPWEHA
jgi:predicted nucleic acid-binding protein